MGIHDDSVISLSFPDPKKADHHPTETSLIHEPSHQRIKTEKFDSIHTKLVILEFELV